MERPVRVHRPFVRLESGAAKKGYVSGEKLEKHTAGAEAHIDLIGFYTGDKSPAYRPAEFSAG
jgi:hypothetical protein